MAPLGIAIVGSGIFVREQHLPAALATPLLTIKAIWSRSLSSAEQAAKLIPEGSQAAVDLYSSDSGPGKGYDDLLKRSDIVGVILALPIPDMPAYIEKALAAGKHVLGEKPIAPTIGKALELVEYYKKVSADAGGQAATWSVAENFRFIPAYDYAVEQIKTLGKMTAFHVKVCNLMEESNKYYGTAWRAKPEFQGGFILDGGVHFTAALRKLLGDENSVQSLSAYTAQVRSWLPPVDSVHAVLKAKSGVIGTYVQSAGSSAGSFQFQIVCENGVVEAESRKCVVIRGHGADAKREEKDFTPTFGVKEEVHAWGEALQTGKPNPAQSPEQAVADLELIEKMLNSGQQGGSSQSTEYQ
ncbi:oxidoreductase [Microdochium trichocladiopsis]|uniref:Oxidoreductase n=1 Tax=Microdochium trichocladiopsis TaxID=1682393 RepID=A0A9P8Y2M8_9PEZI|nr:oxidoreductase [Microdochium trichocladiopsis]KAH7026048.1 oxidoreductase [Microdochium trichocladiopsis]